MSGFGPLDAGVMDKLVLSIQSRKAHGRATATLTLLKLCRCEFSEIAPNHLTMDESDPAVQEACSRHNILDVFMGQLEQKGTSLLAAYALRVCLKHSESGRPCVCGPVWLTDGSDMWTSGDFPRAARSIVGMLDKGWFDDAVGRVEGCGIFRGLMGSGKPG